MLVEVGVETQKLGELWELRLETRLDEVEDGKSDIKFQAQGQKWGGHQSSRRERVLSESLGNMEKAWPFPQSLYGRSQEIWTWGERQLALSWGWPGAEMF